MPDHAESAVDAAASDTWLAVDAAIGADLVSPDQGNGDSAELPTGVDPTTSGSHTWTEVAGTATRVDRQIPVQALRPDDAPLGVVVFLPGFQLEASRYSALQEHLASHGFAVLGADPPASLLSADHVAMALDVGVVFDWALAADGPLAGLDASLPWAVAGHSLGGKVAVMAAARDARVDAVLAIDPVNGAGNGDYTESRPDIVPDEVAPLGIPLGFAGETTNSSGGLGGACAPLDQNFQTFFAAAATSPAAFEWDFTGADHMDFVDDTSLCLACAACPDGSADAAQVQAGMRTLAAAFLLTHLAGRADLQRYLDGDAVPAGVVAGSGP
jgi:pimeloyl-ACP methyl ester carboxylesterase